MLGKNFIFITIRKNASTSIRNFFTVHDLVEDSHKFEAGVRSRDWDSAPPFFKFGVIRNPYTRVISAWKYCKSTRDRSLLDCLENPPIKDLSDAHAVASHDFRHFTLGQTPFIYSTKLEVDHLIKFESLNKGFDEVLSLLNINVKGRLEHLNKTSYPNYELSSIEKDKTYQFYQEDFELLGYKK